ncbi:GNAT family N-acetyltransferase [Pseudochelatococcus sp. G4_1912]|uniref:GNAT family N-acetyltransferase n=1 Tax=Pseudochelatococcus sp. G4_1912 TaxID=3114288 RepID=UPI0039C656AC
MQKSYKLVNVITSDHWKAYHAIRRQVLWRGNEVASYDDKHEDEYLPSNHPLLLLLNENPIGTLRLDNFNDGCGAVRLVAILDGLQRQGHGRQLSSLAEDYARNLGIKTLYVNADPEALEFYIKLGWDFYAWDAEELIDIAAQCKQMRKILS